MTSPLEILRGGLADPHQASKRSKATHPPGMTPRINLDKGEAVAMFRPGEDPCWEPFLKDMGFEGMVQILNVVEVRAWQVYVKDVGLQTLHYVRAKCRELPPVEDRVDVAALIKGIARRKVKAPTGPRERYALVALLADWQAGKREGGGISALIDRVFVCLGRLITRVKKTRPKRVVLAGMGDLFEGCGDHYAMQTFSVDADRREQCRVIRRLVLEIILRVAREVPEVEVVCVGGNHGENRKNGKAFTSFGDNDDVAVFEQVAEICQHHPELSKVSFVVPDQELTATLEIFGVRVAFAHGHQCRRGTKGEKPVVWWKDMTHNRHPVGDCDLLFTGHYHHLKVVQAGPRTWFQCPALDGGSAWWEMMGGDRGMPGMLTVLVGEGLGQYGWKGMEVL